MDRENLIAALERHETDAAGHAALALRAGASFRVWAESPVPASRLFHIWAWRARCMAEDNIVTCKDFEQGLPDLRRAGETPVAMARVDITEDSRLVFLAADLSSCVAVL
ncbi:hypothetical protein ACFV0O_27260 [Kitasatospora sp. NPDC059577]|uniref:hypothetical protein n=1 Tax=Kitasatospora sp. NPDC059577 TaxID=3346873 RepID=UPI0036B1C7D5